MITEDYVSFEIAKLLKEKGFNEQCYAYYNIFYDNDGKDLKLWRKYPHRAQPNTDYLNVPTLQTAMKWLREVHNIHIEVRITNHSLSSLIAVPRYYWIIVNAKEVKWMDESTAHKPMSYETVEEACEAAIKYCLENLI